jgi:DNA-binding PadR family transcriptional regulator
MTTKAELVVLGLLTEGPMHGYELLERFHDRGMGLWTELSRASVYQVLRRLERDGAVVGRAQVGREGPDRRVFRITKAGRDRLARGAVALAGVAGPVESAAAVALGLGHALPAATAGAVTAARERSLLDHRDAIRAELARTADDDDASRVLSTAMLRLQEAFADAELAWLRTYRAGLARSRR